MRMVFLWCGSELLSIISADGFRELLRDNPKFIWGSKTLSLFVSGSSISRTFDF